jgi:hypothetical protein
MLITAASMADGALVYSTDSIKKTGAEKIYYQFFAFLLGSAPKEKNLLICLLGLLTFLAKCINLLLHLQCKT